ncbi:MAG: C69 family dipeptidase [Acidimicrobiia bacterium]
MCDCLVALPAATGTDVCLFAKNSDRPPTEPQDVGWYPPRIDRGRQRVTHIEIDPFRGETLGCVLSRPRWCWGAEHGVNEAGVAIGNEAIYTTLDPRSAAPALIGMDLVRLALERATSATGAVEVLTSLLEAHGQGGSGHDPTIGDRPYWSSFLVADPREAWVVETSGTAWAAEQVPVTPAPDPVPGPAPLARGATRAISNRTTIPSFDAEHRHPRQRVEQLVDPRWHASQEVLRRRPVSLDSLRRHLRSHDSCGQPGWSVCMHVDGVEATTASMIAELAPGGRPSRAWLLLGSPCAGVYVPTVVGEPFIATPWERWAGIGPEHRDALDELEVWLEAECPPAADAWRLADETLDRLLAA